MPDKSGSPRLIALGYLDDLEHLSRTADADERDLDAARTAALVYSNLEVADAIRELAGALEEEGSS